MTTLINKLRTAEQQAGADHDHIADQIADRLESGAIILEAVRDQPHLVRRHNGGEVTAEDKSTATHLLKAVDQVDDKMAAKPVEGIKMDAEVKALVESILKKGADNGGKIILRGVK